MEIYVYVYIIYLVSEEERAQLFILFLSEENLHSDWIMYGPLSESRSIIKRKGIMHEL